MDIAINDCVISDSKGLMDIDRIYEMLNNTYWAKNRSKEVIKKSIENSLCFGVYKGGVQIGFARCVTDYSTFYTLCDVTVDESYRGQGLGKALMKFIIEHELLEPLLGLLGTEDACGLYEQFGFKICGDTHMYKLPNS